MATAAPKRGAALPIRERILTIASASFARHGPEGLRLREIAAAADCSTMIIYSTFGGKDGLIAAIYRSGFERLEASLAANNGEPDPIERLRSLADAYRAFGLADRSLYAAMFSRPMAARHLGGKRTRADAPSFNVLVDAVRYALERGAIALDRQPPARAETVADAVWSVVHGHVSLEITGHFAETGAAANDRYALLVETLLRGLTR
jgi:AcrR family transcriptional regulator